MKTQWFYSIFFSLLLCGVGVAPALAQIEIVDDETGSSTAPETGKKAAQKFFLKRQQSTADQASTEEVEGAAQPSRSFSSATSDRYLMLQAGLFFDEEVYKWGKGNTDEIADWNAGVTYRMGEWVNSMDLSFRADLTSFDLAQGKATKLSLLPLVTFPDVRSRFPLYFGAGAGLGVFFKQIRDESHISFDYQVVAGARLFELVENMGLVFEVGLKNHILILSDGQFNGAFFSAGALFEF
jgi:hypothetical protein